MEGSVKDTPEWLGFVREHVPILVATALFAFMILKVLGISNGNAETAIAVMSSVGVTQVALGAVVASYGLFLLVWIYWLVWWGIEATLRHRSILPSAITALLVSVAIFALDSMFLGVVLLAGSVGAMGFAKAARSWLLDHATGMRVVLAVFGVCGFLAFLSLSGEWLPTEVIVLDQQESAETSEIVAFVLNDKGDWVSVLSEVERVVLRLRSDVVVHRELCTLDTEKFFGPSWVEVVGHDSEPVRLCADVLRDAGRS